MKYNQMKNNQLYKIILDTMVNPWRQIENKKMIYIKYTL